MQKKLLPLLLICVFHSIQSNAENMNITSRFHRSGLSDISRRYFDGAIHSSGENSPDTLKILAIRIEFMADNDRNTTGDGKFELVRSATYRINPPPHDRTYFENQLLALADYFQNVSRGKLIIKGDVFPLESNRAYQLPQQMSYYNPNTTENVLDESLAELFRDAFVAAASDNSIDFTTYDAYIIFHAGVGGDYTFDLESTPNDIPSVFLNFEDLKQTLGKSDPGFEGIQVANAFIREGIILPETQCQMGYDIGLLGTATIMFGHQLGLPNLYDSDTGRPGIGLFGLMDQGSSNFLGMLPAQPCAWSKIFLGWEQPIVITRSTDLEIAAAMAGQENKIFKIPINAKEYYLIENRQRHVLRQVNTTVGYDNRGHRIEFKVRDDGSMEITTASPQDTIGVIVTVEEYDFGLPGSGILIWHIDENVIDRTYHENRVNADINHRGVDLVEADGAQDIGRFYNFFGITGYESGSMWDMWWSGNEAHQAANEEGKSVEFSSTSIPASRAYSNANSFISVVNFSNIDSVMTCTVNYDLYQDNFPMRAGVRLGANAMTIGNIDVDGREEIIAAAQDGRILVWKHDGSRFIQNADSFTVADLQNDSTRYPLAVFAEVNDSTLTSPALADLNGDGIREVIIAAVNGEVSAFLGKDDDLDGRADRHFLCNSGKRITTSPVVLHQQQTMIAFGHTDGAVSLINASGMLVWQKMVATSAIAGMAIYPLHSSEHLVVTGRTGDVVLLDPQGEVVWQKTVGAMSELRYPAVGDIDRNNMMDIIVCSADGQLFGFDAAGQSLPGLERVSTGADCANPTLADLDHDGYLEIVIAGRGYVSAFRYNGTVLDNFPIVIDRSYTGPVYPDPILADLDGDEDVEIIAGTSTGQVVAFHHTGERVGGFPLSADGAIISSPIVSDIDGDGKINLFAVTADGFLYVWNLDASYREDAISWRAYLRDDRHSGWIPKSSSGIPVEMDDLMPAASVYNYPNPTEGSFTSIRYYLSDAADVTIRLYDIAGDLVKELKGTGWSDTHNEIQMALKDIQSGVYLTRVEAKSENKNSIAFFKMAVVK